MSFKKLQEIDNSKVNIKKELCFDIWNILYFSLLIFQIPSIIIIFFSLFRKIYQLKFIIIFTISYSIITLSKLITYFLLHLHFKNTLSSSDKYIYVVCPFIINLTLNILLLTVIIIKIYINYNLLSLIEISYHTFFFLIDMALLIIHEYYNRLKSIKKDTELNEIA